MLEEDLSFRLYKIPEFSFCHAIVTNAVINTLGNLLGSPG